MESREPHAAWSSRALFARFREGDAAAAEELFHRYVQRLTLLARSRLSSRLAAKVDPEDLVYSAYRSFFVGARGGRFSLERSGDLWRLLVSIVLHKLYHEARHHAAGVRSIAKEQPWSAAVDERREAYDREPQPEEAVALADELEFVMSQLDAFGRRVLELRLQDETLEAIAAETGRSERTVRRMLQQIRGLFRERLTHD